MIPLLLPYFFTIQAVRVALDEGICAPILIGDRQKIAAMNRTLGLKLPLVHVHDPEDKVRLCALYPAYVA